MTNPPTLRPEFPTVIDSTIRSDYASCGQKFNYSRIYGLASKGGSVHLIAGGAFAYGTEITRLKFYRDGMSQEDAILEGTLAALEHYADFEPEDKYIAKSAERVVYGLVEYFEEYPMATDKIQPHFLADGSPAIEFEFAIPLDIDHPVTGDPLIYAGRFDMLGSYQNGLWVVDEKTATQLGPSWMRSFTFRGQLLGYCWAAQEHGMSVNGFIIRGMSFLKNYYGHAEVIEPVSQQRIDMYKEQLNRDIIKMVADWNAGQFDYNFGDTCNAYGGCPYRRLCDKSDWKEWWQQYFDVARWNPLTRQEEREDTKVLDNFTF